MNKRIIVLSVIGIIGISLIVVNMASASIALNSSRSNIYRTSGPTVVSHNSTTNCITYAPTRSIPAHQVCTVTELTITKGLENTVTTTESNSTNATAP